MKPIIGITSSLQDEHLITLTQDNTNSITEAGGVPIVLPNLLEPEQIDRIAEHIDGLLLSGGGDIDPTLFGEEPHRHLGSITPARDQFEIELSKRMLAQDKPVLAICRGCQILNIAADGDMYQDIYSQYDQQLLQHQQCAPRSHGSHYVKVKEGSLLHQVTKSTTLKVNSFHHQAVRHMGKDFQVSAMASDGVIEAFESTKHAFVLAVQWHPECMVKVGDTPSIDLFYSFVRACQSSLTLSQE